jgi:hypothetical protein
MYRKVERCLEHNRSQLNYLYGDQEKKIETSVRIDILCMSQPVSDDRIVDVGFKSVLLRHYISLCNLQAQC